MMLACWGVPPAGKRFSAELYASGFAGGMLSCDLTGFQEIGESLFDPDAVVFESPGSRLLPGQFKRLEILGSAQEGVLFALVTDAEEPHLILFNYLDRSHCDAGPVERFEDVSLSLQDPVLLAVQSGIDGQGFGSVRFVDASCQEALPSLQEARLGWAGDHYIHRRDDELVALLGEPLVQKVVAESVRRISTFGDNVYLLSTSGELSARRGLSGDPSFVAEGVENYVLLGSDEQLLAFSGNEQEPPRIVTTLQRGGALLDYELQDACLATDAPYLSRFVFEQPCGSGQYKGFESFFGERPLVFDLPAPEGEFGPMSTLFSDTEGSYGIYFMDRDPATRRGALRSAVYRLTEGQETTPENIGEPLVVQPSYQTLTEDANCAGRRCLVFSGEEVPDLRLLRFDPSEEAASSWELELQAERVGWTSSAYYFCGGTLLLRNFDGESGELFCSGDASGSAGVVLAQGVASPSGGATSFELDSPLNYFFTNPEGGDDFSGTAFFVTDVKDGAGKLRAFDVDLDFFDPQGMTLATGVRPWSDLPIGEMNGVAYLTADGQRTLSVVLRDEDLSFPIHDHVSYYRYLELPALSLAYLVDQGEDAGFWLSKGR